MTVSIIVPAYNSEKSITELIRRLKDVKIFDCTKEIIIVNDCSKDQTWEKLKKIKGIVAINHKKNTGKGGAVRTGLKRAKGDIFFLQDDDLEYDPYDIPIIIKPILDKKAEIVFGSRRLNKNNKYSSFVYGLGGVFVNFLINLILRAGTTDTITGSKAFTKKVYKAISPLQTHGFEIEAEITAKTIKAGFKPLEVPISYNPRTHAEGKNIRWYHGYEIIKTLIAYSWFN